MKKQKKPFLNNCFSFGIVFLVSIQTLFCVIKLFESSQQISSFDLNIFTAFSLNLTNTSHRFEAYNVNTREIIKDTFKRWESSHINARRIKNKNRLDEMKSKPATIIIDGKEGPPTHHNRWNIAKSKKSLKLQQRKSQIEKLQNDRTEHHRQIARNKMARQRTRNRTQNQKKRGLTMMKRMNMFPRYRNVTEPPGSYHCQQMNFSTRPLAITGLVSFMGSGNTWLRHLIQEATGILTGSPYPDPYLFRGGFPGEGVVDGRVIVTKVHNLPSVLKERIEKVIVLIRDPFKAIMADYNRHNRISSNEHTGVAPDRLFGGQDWQTHVKKSADYWLKLTTAWLQSFKGKKTVILYDELKKDTAGSMRKILDFLHVKYSEEKFNCMLRNSEGNFHRKRHKSIKEKYDENLRSHLMAKVAIMNKILHKDFNVTLHVDEPSE